MKKYNLKRDYIVNQAKLRRITGEFLPEGSLQFEFAYRNNSLGLGNYFTSLMPAWLNYALKREFFYFVKDVKDTFKPFKSTRQVLRDLLLQPLKGFWNIIKAVGIGTLFALTVLPSLVVTVGAGIVYIGGLLVDAIKGHRSETTQKAQDILTSLPGMLASMVASTLSSFIRGVTQIAAWPLTLIRMPLRGIITAVTGVPIIEESEGLQELVANYSQIKDDQRYKDTNFSSKAIYGRLLIEKFYHSSIEKHQRTSIDMQGNAALIQDLKKFMKNPNIDSIATPRLADQLLPFLQRGIQKQKEREVLADLNALNYHPV